MRHYSFTDQLLIRLDETLRGLSSRPSHPRPMPTSSETAPLQPQQRRESIRLLRVNHCGEVCAQALYLGQALVARDRILRNELYQAASEEKDHLQWCAARLQELEGDTSLLNPFFALSSLGIGAIAGLAGDPISLGFLAETENQVSDHLRNHLMQLPVEDTKSRAILQQMLIDEQQHATHAIERGGQTLPEVVRFGMKCLSKVMTVSTQYL